MTERPTNLAGFFDRWSRRKLTGGAGDKRVRPATAPDASPRGEADRGKEFADFDFDALDFNADFTRFMDDKVPDSVRNRGLKMLWRSSDLISRPDELDDYLEDFSEEAMALPAELAKSAYQVGLGFVTETEKPDLASQPTPEPALNAESKAADDPHKRRENAQSEPASPLDDEARADVPSSSDV